ncbi:UDP-glucose:glycoprotein glucosyltransferase 2 isoform X1, partial [Tachysurus ichikawai]
DMDQDAFEKKFNTMELGFLHSQQRFCQEVLKMKAGQTAVVSNGRVLGPFAEEEEFSMDDFHLLEKLTLSTSDKIKSKVKQMSSTPKKLLPNLLVIRPNLKGTNTGRQQKITGRSLKTFSKPSKNFDVLSKSRREKLIRDERISLASGFLLLEVFASILL